MRQNALSLSDCSILKSTICLEQNDEVAWFFESEYKCMEIKSRLENIWTCIIKNGHGLLGHGRIKSAVSRVWINELRWFLACWYKFRKA